MHAVNTRRRGIGAVMALFLAALLVVGFAPGRAEAKVTRRHQMLALINHAREDRDLPRLQLTTRLSRVAERHSVDMAREGYIYHSEDLTRVLAPYEWTIGGENVGAGFSVRGLHQAFMRSQPHRENILRSSFDHVGIGFVHSDDALWVTLIFFG